MYVIMYVAILSPSILEVSKTFDGDEAMLGIMP